MSIWHVVWATYPASRKPKASLLYSCSNSPSFPAIFKPCSQENFTSWRACNISCKNKLIKRRNYSVRRVLTVCQCRQIVAELFIFQSQNVTSPDETKASVSRKRPGISETQGKQHPLPNCQSGQFNKSHFFNRDQISLHFSHKARHNQTRANSKETHSASRHHPWRYLYYSMPTVTSVQWRGWKEL